MIFERFTTDARRCVEAALEEARLLGHDSVGDEDLLLGVLGAGEGVAPEALASLGVTLESVRGGSEKLTADALSSIGISLEALRQGAGDAFETRIPGGRRLSFSPRAKKALEQALREARRLRDNRLTSEHVLRGILRDREGTAVRILAGLGASTGRIEDTLDQLRGRVTST
ncbi:MAG: Clp protease N-terminal domain-containing protein [Rubrobacter sp.]